MPHAPRLIVAAALPALLLTACDQQPSAEEVQRENLREGVRLTSVEPSVRDLHRLLDKDRTYSAARLKQIDDALKQLGDAAQKGNDPTKAAALRAIAGIFIERAQYERRAAVLAAYGIVGGPDSETPPEDAAPVVASVYTEAEALTRIASSAAREARTARAIAGAGQVLEQTLADELERLKAEKQALTEGEDGTNRLEQRKTGAEMEAKAAREKAQAARDRAAAMGRDLMTAQREKREALAAEAEQMPPGQAAEARRKLEVQEQDQYLEMLDRRAEAQKEAGRLEAEAAAKDIEAADAAAQLSPLQAKLQAVNAGLRATEIALELIRTPLEGDTLADIEAEVEDWWAGRESPLGEAERELSELIEGSRGGDMSADLGRRMLVVQDRVKERLVELRLESLAAAQAQAALAGDATLAGRLALRLAEGKADPTLLFDQEAVNDTAWRGVIRAARARVEGIEAQAGAYKARKRLELIDQRLAESVRAKLAAKVREQNPGASDEQLQEMIAAAEQAIGNEPQQLAHASRLAHAEAARQANADAAEAIAAAVSDRFNAVYASYVRDVDTRLEAGLRFAEDAVSRLDAAADVPGVDRAAVAADRAAAHLERLVLLTDRAAAADRMMRAAEQTAGHLDAAGLSPQPMQGQSTIGEHATALRVARDQYVADAIAAADAVTDAGTDAADAPAVSDDPADFAALASDHLDRLAGVVVVSDVLGALTEIDRAVTSAVSAESARDAIERVEAAAVVIETWPDAIHDLADRLARYRTADAPLRERRAEAVTTAVGWHITMLATLANALSGDVGTLPQAAQSAVAARPAAGTGAIMPATVTSTAADARQALEQFAAAAESVDDDAAREALGAPLPLFVADLWVDADVPFDATPPPPPEFVGPPADEPTDEGPDQSLVQIAKAQAETLSKVHGELYNVGDVLAATAAAEQINELTSTLQSLVDDYDDALAEADAQAIAATHTQVAASINEAIGLVEALRESMIIQPEFAAVLREPLDRLTPVIDRIKRQRNDAEAMSSFDETGGAGGAPGGTPDGGLGADDGADTF